MCHKFLSCPNSLICSTYLLGIMLTNLTPFCFLYLFKEKSEVFLQDILHICILLLSFWCYRPAWTFILTCSANKSNFESLFGAWLLLLSSHSSMPILCAYFHYPGLIPKAATTSSFRFCLKIISVTIPTLLTNFLMKAMSRIPIPAYAKQLFKIQKMYIHI